MNYLSTPKKDGFRMPGEFEAHSGCIIIWPHRPGSWIYGARAAKIAFAQVIAAIACSENVYVLTIEELMEEARQTIDSAVKENNYNVNRIEILNIDSDDSWARDVGPTFVIDDKGGIRGVDWQFNAWGGEFDGLYMNWDKDDRVAGLFCQNQNIQCYDAHPFVLEGGSIHSDGQGTVIVTESCLLSQGRNPKLTKAEIEDKLKEYLNVQKIIWLPFGIYQDETNEHVDNVCAFVRPGELVLAWTDDENDPQYPMSLADYELLLSETDAMGRSFKVTKLPVPAKPVCLTQYEVDGFEFEEGEDTREVGERLAASYANFYISNDGIILPQFGDENDSLAVEILGECFPERKIYPIYARDIIVGGGNIHCITQQVPKGGR